MLGNNTPETQSAYKQRMLDAGYTQVRCWVPDDPAVLEKIKALAAAARDQHKSEAQNERR